MAAKKKGEQPVEVEATVVETEVAPLTGLDALIGGIAAEAASIAEEYQPHEIADEDDYQQSKRDRADARKKIARLKARYTDQIGAVKQAVRDADARMKDALKPLDSIDGEYKARIGEREEAERSERVAALATAYEDFAPDLVPLVPFSRLMERYGNEREKVWTARSVTEAKAVEYVYEAVKDVAQAEQTIDRMVEEGYREHAKAAYFSTLDLQATLAAEAEQAAQRERLAALEAERREREEARRRAEEERIAAEEAARLAAEAAEAEREPETAPPAPVYEEMPTEAPPAPEIAPQPAPAPPAPPVPDGMVGYDEYLEMCEALGEVPREWHDEPDEAGVPEFVFAGYGTEAQAKAFAEWCERAGVSRHTEQPTMGRGYVLRPEGR